MDRGSRSELLKTIENQQEKIQKYEAKLRDLISAYKGVIKEKEALEASLKALSAVQSSAGAPKPPKVEKPKAPKDEDGEDTELPKEEDEGESGDDCSSHADEQLREQLQTLMSSMATLTQEKSKIEANFLADKKKITQELGEKIHELEEEKRQHNEIVKQMSSDLQEWKNSLRIQQHEREREHHDHAMMLRELQKLLGDERVAKEQVEHQVDELRQELEARDQTSTVNIDHYDKIIQEMKKEHETLWGQIKAAEEKALLPSPAFLQLQQELEDLKRQHFMTMEAEQVRSLDIEHLMQTKAKDGEQRQSTLESKVSELSEIVGNYERLRFQDQQAIQKLKDRITQLDLENTALAQATQRSNSIEQELGILEGTTDLQAIVDKIVKLKEMLKTANERSDKPIDIDELLHSGLGVVDPELLHRKCNEDYDSLREEFERYKLRAQSVLKSKSSKDPSPHLEVDTLKTQVTELKERLFQLRTDYEDQSENLRMKEETFHKSIVSLQEKHTQESTNQQAEYKQRMGELEVEIRRHRERTIALLAEKDRELQSLRMRLPDHIETQYISTYRQRSPESAGAMGASSEEENVVGELLARTAIHGGTQGETTLLHFAQEQARKEVEVQNLRKQKHAVELAMRELQHSSILKEQRYIEQIDLLKEEVRKYERNISRESANLEYLKHVVYHFMVCTDQMGKQGTLNAIATILQFSPKEKDKVQKEIQRSWWNYVKYAQNKTTI